GVKKGRLESRPLSLVPYCCSNLCRKVRFLLFETFTKNESGKTVHRDVCSCRLQNLLDSLVRVLDKTLFKKTYLGVELADLPFDDLFNDGFRLAGLPCLVTVNILLALEDIGSNLFTTYILRSCSCDVHCDIPGQRGQVAIACKFDQDADLTACMDV